MIRKDIVPTVLFVGAILLISIGVQAVQPSWIHGYHYPTVGFITFLMTMSLWLLVRRLRTSGEFVGLYMVLFVTRFLVIASIFLYFKLAEVASLKLLVINFFLVYLSYLVFEIKQLLSNLRANS
jgi:hypothetical protein